MAVTEEQYQADKAARAQLTAATLSQTEQGTPTPTQEENDKLALGLLHPDDKAPDGSPVIPSLAAQNALFEVKAGPPINRDVPMISGTAAVGSTLNCTMGNWTGEPTSYTYQWKRGTTNRGTGASYTVVAADAGGSLTCVVTATNAAGSTAAPPSNAIAIPAA